MTPLGRWSESARKLSSGADLQLAVDAAQVHLDRLGGDEEGLRDVLVGHVLGGHLGHTALAGRQRVDSAQREAARSGARRRELGLGELLQWACAESVGELEPAPEVVARLGTLVGAAQRGAE